MSVLDLHLGIDFGTRYTKTCIRDIGREQSWVVRSGRAESYLDEALILSQVGITTQGKIIAGLTQYEWQKQTESFALKIDYIKMRLAHLDISQDNSQWYSPQIQGLQEYDLPLEEILENICAFFLFKVIQRSQAWFTESQKNLFKNMTVEWGASIGVPVVYWDSPTLNRFEKVLGLAFSKYRHRKNCRFSGKKNRRSINRISETVGRRGFEPNRGSKYRPVDRL